MSESSPEPEPKASTPEISPIERIKGLLVLIFVLGLLILLMTYLPKWMDQVIPKLTGRIVQSEPKADPRVAAEEAAPKEDDRISSQSGEQTEPLTGTDSPSKQKIPRSGHSVESVKEQLLAQLGGPDRIEIRHVAFSDDQSKIVVAVKILATSPQTTNPTTLTEIFFTKDEFNRYVTGEEEQRFDQTITIWPQSPNQPQ